MICRVEFVESVDKQVFVLKFLGKSLLIKYKSLTIINEAVSKGK